MASSHRRPSKLGTKPILEEGKSYGLHKLYKVLAYHGQELRESARPHYNHMYVVKCNVCDGVKRLSQRAIHYNTNKFCRSCSMEQRAKAVERAKRSVYETERNQRDKKTIEDRSEEQKLAESGSWKRN